MKSKQCTSLPESAVESSQTSFWDTDPLLQSSGTSTLAKSSENEWKTDGLMECQCGKAMSSCSIHPNKKDEWIASMRDSLAKILVSPEIKQGLAKIHALDFTEKSYALQMRYSLSTSSWKMSQQSLLDVMGNGSEQSLVILPSEAMMLSGYVYPLPKLGLITNEIDGGYLPSPIASTGGAGINPNNPRGIHQGNPLATWVRWATPRASEYKDSGAVGSKSHKHMLDRSYLCAQAKDPNKPGGKLNPMWIEWLMGFPIGHTESKD